MLVSLTYQLLSLLKKFKTAEEHEYFRKLTFCKHNILLKKLFRNNSVSFIRKVHFLFSFSRWSWRNIASNNLHIPKYRRHTLADKCSIYRETNVPYGHMQHDQSADGKFTQAQLVPSVYITMVTDQPTGLCKFQIDNKVKAATGIRYTLYFSLLNQFPFCLSHAV